jgi:hypothetical protein
MKGLLPKFAYALLAILLVAGLLLTLGQRETKAYPSANSYAPSGLHALRELLETNGVATHLDRLESPRLRKGDLAVVAHVNRTFSFFGGNPLKPVEESLEKFVKDGGTVLVLPFDEDFRARSYTAIKQFTAVVSPDGQEKYEVNSSPLDFGTMSENGDNFSSGGAQFLPIEFEDETYTSWYKRGPASGEPFVAISSRSAGTLCRTADGLFVTNRVLDRGDNAELALRVVNGLLPEGGRVVFVEAAVGEAVSPSLVNVLGPWATGMWMQLTLLFVVIVVTLGIRFGLPDMERRKQRGQREMVDAVADVYNRAKSTAVSLDVAYRSADQRIRRALKLPQHTTAPDRDRLLPPSLVMLLKEVEVMKQPIVEIDSKGVQRVSYRLQPTEALKLMQKLEAELDSVFPKGGNRIS